MYKTKQMEDIKMKKSNLLAVLTAATMAMTMAVPMGMPCLLYTSDAADD